MSNMRTHTHTLHTSPPGGLGDRVTRGGGGGRVDGVIRVTGNVLVPGTLFAAAVPGTLTLLGQDEEAQGQEQEGGRRHGAPMFLDENHMPDRCCRSVEARL